MKRYLIFSYDYYYPEGGWSDFVADGDDVRELAKQARKDHSHIVDTKSMSVVWETQD